MGRIGGASAPIPFLERKDRLGPAVTPGSDERPAPAPAEPYWRHATWWRRAGVASGTVWGASGVTLLGTMLAARGLGPEKYGILIVLLAAAALLTTFLDITLEEALVFLGTRLETAGGAGLRALFRYAGRLDLVLGALVTIVLVLAAQPAVGLLADGQASANHLRVALLAVFVTTVDGTTGAALLVARRPDLRGWAQLSRSVIRLVLFVPAVLLGGLEAVLWAIVVANTAGSAIQGWFAWSSSWRTWPPVDRPLEAPGRLVRFAALSTLTTSIAAAGTSVVPIALARMLDPASVALFAVASVPLVLAGMLSAPLRLALLPEQAARLDRSSAVGARRDLWRLTGVSFLASGATVAVCWLVLPLGVPLLFGREYRDAVPLLRVAVFAVFAVNATSVAKLFLVAAGRPGVRAALSSLELAVVLTLVTAGASDQGLRGATLGYVLALGSTSVIWLCVAARLRPDAARPARGLLLDAAAGPADL